MSTANPERIAQVREFAGLSKTDLAQKLEVSVAAVSQWEDGSKNPTTAKAKAEPLDETIPLVNRSLGKSTLELLEKNNVINIWEILSDLPLPNTVFQSVFERDLQCATRNQVVLAKEFIRPTTDPNNRN